MGLLIRFAAVFALAVPALAAPAAERNHAYAGEAGIEIAAGWSQDALGVFTSPDGRLTVIVQPQLHDDDADDVLDDVVEKLEEGETVVSREDSEQVRDDEPPKTELWTRQTIVTAPDGRTLRRLYAAFYDGHQDGTALAVASGDDAAWTANGSAAREMLESLRVVKNGSGIIYVHDVPDALPADGGLDGFYVSPEQGDAIENRWQHGERTLQLYFSPLGEVVRGPMERFDIDGDATCGSFNAWTMGRYRIEGGEIVMRWCDNTIERLTFAQTGAGLQIGRRFYAAADLSGTIPPKGAYRLRLDLSAPYIPRGGAVPVLRFLDDGKLVLEGIERLGSFKAGATSTARFRLKGRNLTIVYDRGSSEVVGIAQLPGHDGDVIAIRGLIFERAD
ncbi:hypothetical protein sos41_26460 [Alphaproteobacteria bacterium SO-S41]|nr:hypothetical protein sos41_26460 [Alphaproteobacteria bacterium SO-S41]